MHPNPVFRRTEASQSLKMLAERGFGTLAISAEPVPLLAHVPFVLSADQSVLDLHLMRSNPIVRALRDGGVPAKLSVIGPDGYISPDWYGHEDQVPTWNYVAVHVTGGLELLPQAELPDVLDRLSAEFEQRLAPKPAWTSDKMSEGVMDRMMRSIVPLRLRIETLDSTWKLGQNKPEDARCAAAEAVAAQDVGVQTELLGAWMSTPPVETP